VSPSPLVIRTAEKADLPTLLSLYGELSPTDPIIDPATADARFDAMLSHPGMHVLLGFDDATAAATVTLVVIPNLTRNGAPYALIENVVTAARYRKRGYAAALIAHAVETAWDTGCYKVMLLTGSSDPATLRFYENCGFVQNKTGFQIRRSV
jgi:GNAT superfamily N-acetyltransferase